MEEEEEDEKIKEEDGVDKSENEEEKGEEKVELNADSNKEEEKEPWSNVIQIARVVEKGHWQKTRDMN